MNYIPNIDLLNVYSDVNNHTDYPMIAVFDFDNKRLVYCGTAHDEDKSFDAINYCFNNFNIDCVVTEYDKNKKIEGADAKNRCQNELEYSGRIAIAKNTPCVLADTGEKDWINTLIAKNIDYMNKFQTFFMLDDAYKYKQHFGTNFSIQRAIDNVVDKYWDAKFPKPMNKTEFQKYFMKNFGFEVTDDNISDVLSEYPDWNEPNANGNLINTLWADINRFSRDPYMLNCIFDSVNKYNCVLATFGAGHFDDQRRVLEYAFGKPKFITEY